MLSVEQIKELISHGENEMIEFKLCADKVTSSVYETVCSFLNREGGHVFLGVSDNKEIVGVNKNSANDMMKNIINTLNNPQFIEPTICINPKLIEVDGKYIISLNIPESLQVHRYKNRIYDRLGDADNDISKNHYLIDNVYLRKRREYSENEICPFVTIDDMDEDTFKTMRSHISIHNENHPWLKMTNEEILHSTFWGKDRQHTKRVICWQQFFYLEKRERYFLVVQHTGLMLFLETFRMSVFYIHAQTIQIFATMTGLWFVLT